MKRLLGFLLVPAVGLAVGFLPDHRTLAPKGKPFTALARINAHGGVGCGVLVGPDLLLTCSHCLASEERKLYDDVDIELGVGFEATTHHAKVRECIKMTGVGGNYNAGDDWAIVRLDRPLGLYYGWLGSYAVADTDWPNQAPELLGYCDCPDEARPEFGHMDKPYLAPGKVTHVGAHILFNDCAMWGGTSGAPLLVKDDKGQYAVAALNFAGVSADGEKLEHGFRAKYSKELANLAIPATSWQQQLAEVKPGKISPLKTVWVRNRLMQPLKVSVRYRSIFQDPHSDSLQTAEIDVPWQQRVALLRPEDGCVESEVLLCVTDAHGNSLVPKPTLEVEVNGKTFRFLKKSIGSSAEYTTFLP